MLFYVYQCAGALLATAGVGITVLGLHGMKIHGKQGNIFQFTMPRHWYSYVICWAIGQALQLSAVKFADEPVVAAFSNTAVIFNAWLAHRMLGERITSVDVVAIVTMIGGACLVVIMCPAGQQSLTLEQAANLFVRSPWPAVGMLGTASVAMVAAPLAFRSFVRRAPHRPSGGVAWGLLAGFSGAISMTSAKVCMLLLDHYGFPIIWELSAIGIALISFVGEVGMVVFVICGMQRHEASLVVPTYYISMTLFASLQGLCLFLEPQSAGLTPSQVAGFVVGVRLPLHTHVSQHVAPAWSCPLCLCQVLILP